MFISFGCMTTNFQLSPSALAEGNHSSADIRLHEVPAPEPVPPFTTPPTAPPAQDPGDPASPEIPVREPPAEAPPIRMNKCMGTTLAM